MLLGVDGAPGDASKYNTNSDVMVFANYNRETKKIKMISIPRDTYVDTLTTPIPKINSAHAKGGCELSKEVVGDLLKTKVDYFVKINYEGFHKFIDAIGGVDVVIPRNMYYDDASQNLHIHFNKGEKVHLDGQKAEEYIRWRKNNDNTGFDDRDLGRIKKMQDFMEAVMEKVKSPLIITKLNDIMNVVTESIKTDMPVNDILKYGLEVTKIDKENIDMEVLPGEFNKIYNEYAKTKLDFYIVDRDKLGKILEEDSEVKSSKK
ncbi:LCP family protein [Haloimpatiens sp. FM7315]|uniref:LCP family protein n=1 Tax=Haloimpatiens sp. FM7315 TaxID=3298609 RepID=UPI0035A33FB8